MRFIDVEFNIPTPNGKKYFNSKMQHSNDFYKCIINLAVIFNLSLREYDKLIIWIKALLATPNSEIYNVADDLLYYYAYILLLKLKYPNIFRMLSSYDGLYKLDIAYSMPHAKPIDKLTKKQCNVSITLMIFAVYRENVGLQAKFPGEMSDRELEWHNDHGIKKLLLNGIKELNFLDRFNN